MKVAHNPSESGLLEELFAGYERKIKEGMERALWVIAYRGWAEQNDIDIFEPGNATTLTAAYGADRATVRALEVTWERWDSLTPQTPFNGLTQPLETLVRLIVEAQDEAVAADSYPLATLFLGALTADEYEDEPVVMGRAEFSPVIRTLDELGYARTNDDGEVVAVSAWTVGRDLYTDSEKAEDRAVSNRQFDQAAGYGRGESDRWAIQPITKEWWDRHERRRISDSYVEAVQFGSDLAHMAAETGVSWFASGVHNNAYVIRMQRFSCTWDGDRVFWTGGPAAGVALVEIFDHTTRFGRLNVINAGARGSADGPYIVEVGPGWYGASELVLSYADSPEEAVNWAIEWVRINRPGWLSNDDVAELLAGGADYEYAEQDMISDDNGNYIRSEQIAGYPSNRNFRRLTNAEVIAAAFPEGVPK